MSTTDASNPPSSPPQTPAPCGDPAPALPAITTELPAEALLERLRTLSKRGKLPGFESGPGPGSLFSVAAHGNPFDSRMEAAHQPHPEASGSTLTFTLRRSGYARPLFLIALITTVWPGVYFMDEAIALFLPSLWRPWITYYWYIPLTLLPAPFIWSKINRRSDAAVRTHAVETIQKIAKEIAGRIDTPA